MSFRKKVAAVLLIGLSLLGIACVFFVSGLGNNTQNSELLTDIPKEELILERTFENGRRLYRRSAGRDFPYILEDSSTQYAEVVHFVETDDDYFTTNVAGELIVDVRYVEIPIKDSLSYKDFLDEREETILLKSMYDNSVVQKMEKFTLNPLVYLLLFS